MTALGFLPDAKAPLTAARALRESLSLRVTTALGALVLVTLRRRKTLAGGTLTVPVAVTVAASFVWTLTTMAP